MNKGYGASGQCVVAIDLRYMRPSEVETLLGDASKARAKLGWTPKVTFQELVAEMAKEDFVTTQRDARIQQHGYAVLKHHE